MGGNALSIAVERMDKVTHTRLSKHVIETLATDSIRADVTAHYRLKETFGDIDILVVAQPGMDWKQYIIEHFAPDSMFQNGTASDNVHSFSFNIEQYQTDLLIVKADLYKTTQFYYSCGMFGDLVGRVAMGMGAKFGVFGLEYRHHISGTTQRIGTVNLSMDKHEIIEALGFSLEQFDKGFDTVKEMFDFVISSKHFNIHYFDFDNLNAAKRAKNLRRKEYVEFLEYVKVSRPDVFEKPKLSVDEQMKWMLCSFPNARIPERITKFENVEQQKAEVKIKFNGKIVMERLGLTNKELSFLKGFAAQFDNYNDYILSTELDQILVDVSRYREVSN